MSGAGAVAYWIDREGMFHSGWIDAARLRRGMGYRDEAMAAFDWPEHLEILSPDDAAGPIGEATRTRMQSKADEIRLGMHK